MAGFLPQDIQRMGLAVFAATIRWWWRFFIKLSSKTFYLIGVLCGKSRTFPQRTPISVEHIEQAIILMNWYLSEARRLLEPQSNQPNVEVARKLLVWLLQQRPQTTTPHDILQFCPLRNKDQRDNALETLVEHQHIRLIKTGNKTHITLNPWCK